MSSTMEGIKGGSFSKNARFFNLPIATPGPIYGLPSLFEEHCPSPLYRGNPEMPGPVTIARIPHPSKDRTAWMIGTTKDDLAYYSNMACSMGPAYYKPNIFSVKPVPPRTVFSKNPRFSSLTHRYMSKEHNNANLCTAGPGPKYWPKYCQTDFTKGVPPKFSFGSKNVSDRSSFLHSKLINGYVYRAAPATFSTTVNISPANYTPRDNAVLPCAPRPKWGKADRFRDQHLRFVSKKLSKASKGVCSPGPCYYPSQYSLSTIKRHANVSGNKWCP